MGVARRLALGRLISLSGGSAAYIALVAAIYGRTHSAVWVSAAIFASVVASVASAPLAGWIGDRFDRRRVLVVADLAAAVVSLAMALTGQPWALVVLLGLGAVAQSPFEPASAAALPNLVEPKDVPRANALVAATSSAAYLAGPLLGGLVLGAGASPSTLFAVDAATFVVSALLVATIRRPFGSGATGEHPGMLAGFRVIVREPRLRIPVLAGMVSLVGVGIVDVASYPLSLHLHGGTQGYGAMTALLGGGGLLGAALAGRVLRAGSSRMLIWSFFAGAAGLALAGAAPVLAIALGGMALAGAGRGLGDVAATTLIQEQTNDAVRSRVFAAQEGAAHAAFSVSALSGGLLVQLVSARGAFAVATVFGIGAAAIAATGCSRRSVEPRTPSPARHG
jgi:MFS family permease